MENIKDNTDHGQVEADASPMEASPKPEPGKGLDGSFAANGSKPDDAVGSIDFKADYRKLGQPADTVSGTTRELFEVRSAGGKASDGSSAAFKVAAAVAIVALVLAIVATQVGLFGR